MKRFLVIPLLLLAAGCANLTEADCQSDWRQLGWRDGSSSGQNMIVQYQTRCPGADASAYAAGWTAGKWEKDHRRF